MKTIEEIEAGLSDSEREQFKDVIQQVKQRKIECIENNAVSQKGLEKITSNLAQFVSNMLEINKNITLMREKAIKAKELADKALDKINAAKLAAIPKDKLFKA